MVTQTTQTTTGCNFRVDKCQTSVATDPAYVVFKDGKAPLAPAGSGTAGPGYAPYEPPFAFVDFAAPSQQPTVDDLVALIRSNLSNCPEVTVKYDNGTGEITVHYLTAGKDCDCDWVVNVRDVKADDFVVKRTSDNYSPYLGQMERRQFHCTSEQGAQKIASACEQICKLNGWTTYK